MEINTFKRNKILISVKRNEKVQNKINETLNNKASIFCLSEKCITTLKSCFAKMRSITLGEGVNISSNELINSKTPKEKTKNKIFICIFLARRFLYIFS